MSVLGTSPAENPHHLEDSDVSPIPMQETYKMWVRYLGQEEPLKEGMGTHSSILAWRIQWTEEPGGVKVHRIARN